MTMTSETFPSTGAQRRRVAAMIELERDDSRSHLPGTSAYRPGCIAGWGPRLG